MGWPLVVSLIFLAIPILHGQQTDDQEVPAASEVNSHHVVNTCLPDHLPVQIVILFDITPVNATIFLAQQSRLERTLRYMDEHLRGRGRMYALIVFHRDALVFNPNAQNVNKIVEQITELRLCDRKRKRLMPSPVNAFDLAGKLISVRQRSLASGKTKYVILLAHDGRNKDSIADTLETTAILSRLGVEVFAVSGNDQPVLPVLVNYANDRSQVFTENEDAEQFFKTLDRKLGYCPGKKLAFKPDQNDEQQPTTTTEKSRRPTTTTQRPRREITKDINN